MLFIGISRPRFEPNTNFGRTFGEYKKFGRTSIIFGNVHEQKRLLLVILVHIRWSSARQAGCDERGPICGNDGKTYTTMCQLIWARLEDTDLAVLHEGSCNGKYISPILEPSEGEDDVTGSGNVLMKLVTSSGVNYQKIKAIMPVGWPPLGPMLVTQARKV